MSAGSGKRQETSIPRGFQGQGRDHQGQGQIRLLASYGPMTCFHYH